MANKANGQQAEIINKRVAVSGLKPHPRNYNQHDAGQVADLRESLRQFGQVRSIVVQATKRANEYLIVAGHGIEIERLESNGQKETKRRRQSQATHS